MTDYGWYLDGSSLGEGSSEDPYKVIQMAVDVIAKEAADDGWTLGLLLVGPLETHTPSEHLDADWIRTAWADGTLTSERITDWLMETNFPLPTFPWETVQRLERTLATALTAATEANVVEVVHRWADSEIGERVWCDGVDALPVEHDGDEWHRGGVVAEPRATISPTVDSATGTATWVWWAYAPGCTYDDTPITGDAPTLAEAMDATLRVVRGIE